MNKVISFILGALVMFVIMFSIDGLKDDSIDVSDTASTSEVTEVHENRGEISKQVAFVNNDIGVGDANIATSLIENMPMKNGYQTVTTTYNDATTGIENDEYVAYVIFDSNYSATLLSVATDELPEKAKITVKINSNLSDEQLTEVNQVLLADYMYIKDTINYIYIAYLLDIVHNTQDDVSSIISNEEYMNSIAEGVSEYTTNIVTSLTEYLKEPPSTEIELDLTGLQGLTEKNVDLISKQLEIDSDQLLSSITEEQTQLNTSVNQSLLESDITVPEFSLDIDGNEDFDENFNNYLITNITNLKHLDEVLTESDSIITDYFEIPTESMPKLDQLEILAIGKAMAVASVKDEPERLDVYADSYKFEVINNFVLSYASWYASVNHIPLETCEPDASGGYGACMANFNSAYGDQFEQWISIEENLESIYSAITSSDSDFYTNIRAVKAAILDLYEGINNRDRNYVNNILEDQTVDGDIQLTTSYCNGPLQGENAISDLVCGAYDGYNTYETLVAAISAADGETDSFVTSLESEAEELNTSIDTANEEVNQKLIDQQTSTNESIKNGVNDANEAISTLQIAINNTITDLNAGKNGFIGNLVENMQKYQTELNEKVGNVEAGQYDDRQKAYDAASSYNDAYATAADGYTTNISLLNLFADILPSTRNGNDANYYLYDYLVNPLDIILKSGLMDKEESLDPVVDSETSETNQPQTEEGKNMLIVIGVAFILIIGLGIYMVFKKVDYDD